MMEERHKEMPHCNFANCESPIHGTFFHSLPGLQPWFLPQMKLQPSAIKSREDYLHSRSSMKETLWVPEILNTHTHKEVIRKLKYVEACFFVFKLPKNVHKRNQRPPFLSRLCHLLDGKILVKSSTFFYKPVLIMFACFPHPTKQK